MRPHLLWNRECHPMEGRDLGRNSWVVPGLPMFYLCLWITCTLEIISKVLNSKISELSESDLRFQACVS